jgi:hypothetical protein
MMKKIQIKEEEKHTRKLMIKKMTNKKKQKRTTQKEVIKKVRLQEN